MTAKTATNLNTTGMVRINWVEDARVLTTTKSSATDYVIVEGMNIENHDANISVSLRLFDQYGYGIRQNAAGDAYIVTMDLNETGHTTDYVKDRDDDEATGNITQGRQLSKNPNVSSSSSRRGMARALFAVDNIAETQHSLAVTFTVEQPVRNDDGGLDSRPDDVNDPETLGVQITYVDVLTDVAVGEPVAGDEDDPGADVTYVYTEAKEKDGDNKQVTVDQLFGADKKKKIPASHFATLGEDSVHGVLYGMDSNDTYIKDGAVPPPCEIFRPELMQQVRVVIYSADSDKTSIFDIDTELSQTDN